MTCSTNAGFPLMKNLMSMSTPINMINKIKFVFSDIDGTILTSNHLITNSTKEVCQIMQDKKIRIILTSARMPTSILNIQKELGIKEAIICYNGSLIYNENGNTILSKHFSCLELSRIYSIVLDFPVSSSFFSEKNWIVTKYDSNIIMESSIVGVKPTIGDVFKYSESINKILCIGNPMSINALYDTIRNLSNLNVNIEKSKPTYLEISPQGTNKFTAFNFLMDFYEIKRETTFAIGDGENDVDMLKYAGTGIAMGNAPQIVQESAKHITMSNDDEGFSLAIKKFVLKDV